MRRGCRVGRVPGRGKPRAQDHAAQNRPHFNRNIQHTHNKPSGIYTALPLIVNYSICQNRSQTRHGDLHEKIHHDLKGDKSPEIPSEKEAQHQSPHHNQIRYEIGRFFSQFLSNGIGKAGADKSHHPGNHQIRRHGRQVVQHHHKIIEACSGHQKIRQIPEGISRHQHQQRRIFEHCFYHFRCGKLFLFYTFRSAAAGYRLSLCHRKGYKIAEEIHNTEKNSRHRITQYFISGNFHQQGDQRERNHRKHNIAHGKILSSAGSQRQPLLLAVGHIADQSNGSGIGQILGQSLNGKGSDDDPCRQSF